MPRKGQFLFPVINGLKKCAKCLVDKPVSAFPRHTRKHKALLSRCRTCQTLVAREYQLRPKNRKRIKEYYRRRWSDPIKREKMVASHRKHLRKPETKLKMNLYKRRLVAEKRKRCLDYLGGQCICCGYKKCARALEFHHTNPAEKELRKSIPWCWPWRRKKKELDKCILVCANCHREIHDGIIQLSDIAAKFKPQMATA